MKQQKKQKPYQEKFESEEGMSVGELSHHIGKKMTEKVQKSQKETFIIFLLGIIITLCVVGVVYSVTTIRTLTKNTNIAIEEMEDWVQSIESIDIKVTEIETLISEVDKKHDNIIEGVYLNLDTLDANQKQIVDRVEEIEDIEDEDYIEE